MTQEKIFKIKVKYFLTPEGLSYFPRWYKEVLQEVAYQIGFVDMTYTMSKRNPLVALSFINEAKLESWASTERHDERFEKIVTYFTQPVEVKIEKKEGLLERC